MSNLPDKQFQTFPPGGWIRVGLGGAGNVNCLTSCDSWSMCHGKVAEHRIDILRSIGKPLCRLHTGFISALSTVDCSQREGGLEVLVHQDKDSAVI